MKPRMKNNYRTTICDYLSNVKKAIDGLCIDEIGRVVNILSEALENEKMIFIMGNGGSASTASHIVCDMNKGVSYGQEKRFKMMCLSDNAPSLMAYANDVSYEDVFVEQLKNFLKPGDVVIGISASGNSKNVIKAIEFANGKDAITVGFCGCDGGHLKKLAKLPIHISSTMQVSEDVHMILGHIFMQVLK